MFRILPVGPLAWNPFPFHGIGFWCLSIKFADESQSEDQVSAREQATSNQAPANMSPSTTKTIDKENKQNSDQASENMFQSTQTCV